jgi:uracil-DNA glycosylase family 4
MSDAVIQARLRLWLGAERALGLSWASNPPESPPPPPSPVIMAESTPAPLPKSGLFVAAPAAAPPSMADISSQPFAAPILPTEQKKTRLAVIDRDRVKGCRLCRLCETRTHTVFGEGDCDAKIFFIGEGPGETEDLTGRPFVGKAGQLLDKMIVAMGLKREQVFIANIVKCRPPGNRAPAPDEIAACTPYLLEQLEIIRPRAIVTLGLPAARYMLQSTSSMGRLRGNWHTWRGIKLMPTFHPAFLLRSYTEENRQMVWSDLKQVMVEIGLNPKK